MGGKCPHRNVKKRRYSHKTKRRSKFLIKGDDAVYAELKKMSSEDGGGGGGSGGEGEGERVFPVDEDLPGLGQFYCLHCDRYFASAVVRDEHFKSKRHKKRLKQMAGPAPHTQLDADIAGGMGPALSLLDDIGGQWPSFVCDFLHHGAQKACTYRGYMVVLVVAF
ncbi:Zinc finger protein 593-like protein [Drosera capensis]